MSAFPPPSKSLITATKMAVVLVIPLVAAVLVAGDGAILPATMGLMTVTAVLYCNARESAILLLGVAITGYLATLASGHPVAVVGVVVGACLLAGLLSRLSAGMYGVAPIVAGVLGLNQPQQSPLEVALIIAAVGLYVVVVVTLLKGHLEQRPVPWDVAVRHAIVMAVACGGATAVAVHYDWPKSYWLVMTLAIVLRPYAVESLTKNRQRVVGTVGGAIVAAALSPLPRSLQMVFVVVCMSLMLAYVIERNYVLQVTFTTPMVIFLVSSGTVDETLSLDWLRVVYTVGAAVIGGLVSLGLARQQIDASASPA